MPFQRSCLREVRHLEEFDRAVAASCHENLAVGRERHGADPIIHRFLESSVILHKEPARFGGIVVRAVLPMAVVEHLFLTTRKNFPDFDFADVTSTGQMNTIR